METLLLENVLEMVLSVYCQISKALHAIWHLLRVHHFPEVPLRWVLYGWSGRDIGVISGTYAVVKPVTGMK